MAHLSFALSGIVLPKDHFGSHLKDKEIVDEEKFEKNMEKAGTSLSEVWTGLVIDNNEVFSQFIKKNMETEFIENVDDIDFEWIQKHVVLSRHSIQIAKCFDENCDCKIARSNLFNLNKLRFIPPPYAINMSEAGLKLLDPSQVDTETPFRDWPDLQFRIAHRINDENLKMDTFNAELSKEELKKLICPICKEQFQNKTFALAHRRALHKFSFVCFVFICFVLIAFVLYLFLFCFFIRFARGRDINVDIELDAWEQGYDFDLKQLLKVIDYRAPDEYLCTFKDEHWEWMCLDRDVAQVQEYWDYIKEHPKSNNIEDDIYGEWASNGYVLDVDAEYKQDG